MLKVTAIVPAFNEARRITSTLIAIRQFVDEVIVVDDASTDETALTARSTGATVVTHNKNKGYIEAIKTGFMNTSGDIVITFDADGEFLAQEIPELIKPIIKGEADMVQGHRKFVVRPSEKVITWFAQRKTDVGDSGTGLRAIRADLAKTLQLKGACICGIFSLEVAFKGGRIKEIPISLQDIDKPRKIAWFHLRQLFYVFPWYFKKFRKA
ncbi:glycosyltransferase family 2 protein [Pseudomonadota bacterium]